MYRVSKALDALERIVLSMLGRTSWASWFRATWATRR